MKYTVHQIEREFPPREVEEITGVSVTAQRDWRRRGLLPQRKSEGWTVFGLVDVVEILVMKMLSDSGIPLKGAAEIAALSTLPVHAEFRFDPDNYSFEGLELSQEQHDRILLSSVVGVGGRYLLVPLPANDEAVIRVRRGDALQQMLDDQANGGAAHYLVIDHAAVAERLVQSVTGPLYRIVVEAAD